MILHYLSIVVLILTSTIICQSTEFDCEFMDIKDDSLIAQHITSLEEFPYRVSCQETEPENVHVTVKSKDGTPFTGLFVALEVENERVGTFRTRQSRINRAQHTVGNDYKLICDKTAQVSVASNDKTDALAMWYNRGDDLSAGPLVCRVTIINKNENKIWRAVGFSIEKLVDQPSVIQPVPNKRQNVENRPRTAAQEQRNTIQQEEENLGTDQTAEDLLQREREQRSREVAEKQRRNKGQKRVRELAAERARLAAAERARQNALRNQQAAAKRNQQTTPVNRQNTAAEKQQQAAEQRDRQAAEERERQAAEKRARQAAEERERQAAEERERQAASERAKRERAEREQREREEAERLKRIQEQERARQAAEQAELQRREREERERQERVRRERENRERREREEAERLRREQAERKRKEQEERERRQREEAERLRREQEERERREREERERKEREERERKEREEAARLRHLEWLRTSTTTPKPTTPWVPPPEPNYNRGAIRIGSNSYPSHCVDADQFQMVPLPHESCVNYVIAYANDARAYKSCGSGLLAGSLGGGGDCFDAKVCACRPCYEVRCPISLNSNADFTINLYGWSGQHEGSVTWTFTRKPGINGAVNRNQRVNGSTNPENLPDAPYWEPPTPPPQYRAATPPTRNNRTAPRNRGRGAQRRPNRGRGVDRGRVNRGQPSILDILGMLG